MNEQELWVVHRSDLDTARWELLLTSDPNASLYQMIWYLDLITQGDWYAVVNGDYKAALAFAITKKGFGRLLSVDNVVNPLLCQKSIVLPSKRNYYLDVFVAFLQNKYRAINLKIEHQGLLGYDVKTLQNHALKLEIDYVTTISKYTRNTKRNIKSALESGVTIGNTSNIASAMKLLTENDVTGHIAKNQVMISNLLTASIQSKQGYMLEAVAQNESCAVGFFINFNQRVYFLLCASSEVGIKLKAMYALIDHAINISAGSYEFFDFTGSNIDSIARRNLGFGAEVEKYDIIKLFRWFSTLD